MADPVAPVLTPGENTTEFATMQNSAWWGKALIIIGALLSVLPPVVEAIKAVPGAESNRTLTVILSGIGVILAVAGSIKKGMTDSAYITGRSTVKAAALRDAPVPPPQV